MGRHGLPYWPLQEWVERQLRLLGDHDNPAAVLASQLWPEANGSGERYLYRWRNALRAGSRDGVKGDYPTETASRDGVIDALSNMGLRLADVYDVKRYPWLEDLDLNLDEDVVLEPDAFCERCHELVTPIGGCCPWCDSQVVDGFDRVKGYCPDCDKMLYPANDGSCWICGTMMEKGAPFEPCACGCGQMKRRFDPQGRPCQYVRGHAPRSLEKPGGMVDVEPLAEFLAQRLRTMDLIQALAREVGLSRDHVAAVLERRDPQVPREWARRATWASARAGLGKGAKARPGAVSFFDLYPADRRSRICPGCGEGKAPAAALCKACRRKQGGPGAAPPRVKPRISDETLAAAYVVYEGGTALLGVAEQFIERVPHRSVASLAQMLSKGFKQKGWPMRQRTRSSRQAAA
jgi:hypothetical protein